MRPRKEDHLTTSGSELEIEQRLKSGSLRARNSLLDFAQHNSWIKKSNYEGIFNGLLVIFLFLLIHKPLVSLVYAMRRSTGSGWDAHLSRT